jgi:lipooligosaccharide transport system permease protein
LIAFGFGVGGFIPDIKGLPYIYFIAPALVAIAVMNGSFFECTFASFVRMYFQKTFDAIVATPVSVEEVVAGELLWGATRAMINATIVLAVIGLFGLITSPLFLFVPIIAFFGGLLFAAIAMCFTAIVPNIDSFNYPTFLFITPMIFLSGTFFPLTSPTLPSSAQVAAMVLLPLTHIVNVIRGVVSPESLEPILGLNPELLITVSILWLVAVTVFFFILAINLMKKRLTA